MTGSATAVTGPAPEIRDAQGGHPITNSTVDTWEIAPSPCREPRFQAASPAIPGSNRAAMLTTPLYKEYPRFSCGGDR